MGKKGKIVVWQRGPKKQAAPVSELATGKIKLNLTPATHKKHVHGV